MTSGLPGFGEKAAKLRARGAENAAVIFSRGIENSATILSGGIQNSATIFSHGAENVARLTFVPKVFLASCALAIVTYVGVWAITTIRRGAHNIRRVTVSKNDDGLAHKNAPEFSGQKPRHVH